MNRKINRLISFLIVLTVILCISCYVFASAQTENPPIKIGVAVSLTGALSRNGMDQKMGYELWQEKINKSGGLLGRKVELVIYDDRSDPMTGARLYEKLITDDKVDLLMGPYGSSVTAAVSTVTEKYKMVLIAPGASSNEIWERGYKYVFQIITPSRYILRSALEIAKVNGYNNIAVANADSAFSGNSAKGTLEIIEELGLNLVTHEEYPLEVKDLSSLILKIKSAEPDVVISISYLPDATLFVRQAKDANLTPKLFQFAGTGPSLPDFCKALGEDANGMVGTSQWEPGVTYSGSQEFVDSFNKKFPEASVSYSTASGYAACEILGIAVEEVQSLDQEDIREAVLALDIVTPFGRFKVDPEGNQIGHATVLVQVQDGERVVVWPEEVAEKEIILPFQGWN